MAMTRTATATWQGDLLGGSGDVSTVTSTVLSEQATTWRARTEEAGGLTSPEELLAAAHASCFSMASSNNLAKAGFPPERMEVTVEITADKTDAGWTVQTSRIRVHGRVPGVDEETFQQQVEAAKDGCPISRALKGNVEMTVEATLEA